MSKLIPKLLFCNSLHSKIMNWKQIFSNIKEAGQIKTIDVWISYCIHYPVKSILTENAELKAIFKKGW